MDNKSLNNIKEITKQKIAVSNFQKEINEERKIHMKRNKRKMSIVACAAIILTSGLVFAKDITNYVKKYAFGLGDGVDKAAEHGYIEEPEQENNPVTTTIYKESKIEEYTIDVNATIESFLMDDYNLSTEFKFEFDEKINEVLDLDKLDQITLNDLIVIDEENRIIYASTSMGERKFNEFCVNKELDYTFGKTNENYMNCGLNWFPKNVIKSNNQSNLIYNIYTDTFPKSKELNFYFTEIILTEYNYENEEKIKKDVLLKGDWSINVNVPEKMYNRTSENYKVISCSNDKFEVYAAKVMDTGFEIGVIISDIEKPEYPQIIREKERELLKKYEGVENRNEYSKEWSLYLAQMPQRELWNEYQFKKSPINVTGYNSFIIDEERANKLLNNPDNYSGGFEMPEKTNGSYVLNSEGEKFVCTLSPSRKTNNRFETGNRFDFYETFSMTKYDATDKINVILEFYGEPVTIELEKIK